MASGDMFLNPYIRIFEDISLLGWCHNRGGPRQWARSIIRYWSIQYNQLYIIFYTYRYNCDMGVLVKVKASVTPNTCQYPYMYTIIPRLIFFRCPCGDSTIVMTTIMQPMQTKNMYYVSYLGSDEHVSAFSVSDRLPKG